MDQTANHPAAKVLLECFSEMNEWEREAARHYECVNWGNADEDQLARDDAAERERLERIFEKYCEVGKNAERLQDLGWSFSLQPEHEGEIVVKVTEKPGRVIVETRQTRPNGWEFRYELVQVAGEWRVRDNRKRRSQGDARWTKDLL